MTIEKIVRALDEKNYYYLFKYFYQRKWRNEVLFPQVVKYFGPVHQKVCTFNGIQLNQKAFNVWFILAEKYFHYVNALPHHFKDVDEELAVFIMNWI